MKVCKRVTYAGRVQGVGFRYTARHLADKFPVGGYVRNLADGNVELVAEGTGDQVEAFLQAVAARMGGNIRNQTVTEEEPQGFEDFDIRF
jgi:acylphosphatase